MGPIVLGSGDQRLLTPMNDFLAQVLFPVRLSPVSFVLISTWTLGQAHGLAERLDQKGDRNLFALFD